MQVNSVNSLNSGNRTNDVNFGMSPLGKAVVGGFLIGAATLATVEYCNVKVPGFGTKPVTIWQVQDGLEVRASNPELLNIINNYKKNYLVLPGVKDIVAKGELPAEFIKKYPAKYTKALTSSYKDSKICNKLCAYFRGGFLGSLAGLIGSKFRLLRFIK